MSHNKEELDEVLRIGSRAVDELYARNELRGNVSEALEQCLPAVVGELIEALARIEALTNGEVEQNDQ